MIELQDVSFSYDSSNEMILNNVNLSIKAGEFVLLVGNSGCGKTTITRFLNVLAPDFFEGELKGTVIVDGKNTNDVTVQEMSRSVGSVFQDPRSQFFTLDTTAELAFSCENVGLNRQETIKRVVESAELIDITHLLGKSVFELSSGEKQAIALASVCAHKPKILVLDEPSANLDQDAMVRLKHNLEALKARGHTIVISEHRIHYIKDLCDKVVHISNGMVDSILTGDEFRKKSNEELNSSGLRSLSVDGLKKVLTQKTISAVHLEKDKKNLLALEKVDFNYNRTEPLLENINLTVSQGEIIGLIGNNGAGKTTLMELICGLKKQKSGKIYIGGKKTKAKSRIKQTYYVMQDSDYQLFTESVENELFLDNKKTESSVEAGMEILTLMGLSDFLERHPASLSGGQKQRLSIAISFMKDVEIICFDEPTSGLDYYSMQRVVKLFKRLSSMGKGIIVATHDFEFAAACCTAVYNM